MPPAPDDDLPPDPLRLVLASASPRRLDLLRSVGLDPLVDPADVDEDLSGHPDAETAGIALAQAKAAVVAARHRGAIVLGADTIVDLDGELLAKPADATDAARMLRGLSGRTHRVVTAIAVVDPTGAARASAHVTTVRFHPLSDADIDAYVATGEPDDAAGAYAIQGRAAVFVAEVAGEPSTVVGLPLAATVRALRAAGLDLAATWRGGPDTR